MRFGDFEKIQTEEELNNFYNDVVYFLAKDNNIAIKRINESLIEEYYFRYGKPSAQDIFIIDGELYIPERDEDTIYELVLHELIHILSVPAEYRYLMNFDTEQSYKIIKRIYNDPYRICTESAVIGAQHIIFSDIGARGQLFGSFFKGDIRNRNKYGEIFTSVKDEWISRGRMLLNSINYKI